MSETTGGVPMFVCGPTTGCGKLTPMEPFGAGWRMPKWCQHCGKRWRFDPLSFAVNADGFYEAIKGAGDEEFTAGGMFGAPARSPAPRCEDAAGDGGNAELLLMFADLICPKLRDLLVPHGASATNWDDAAKQLRGIAAALSTAEREREALEGEYRELCLVLRTAVERHKLGLGGERLEALLIQALDERTAALRYILRVYELPDVGPLDDAVERARASLARVPSGGET